MAVPLRWIYHSVLKTSVTFARCQTIKRCAFALAWLNLNSQRMPALQNLQVWTDASFDQSLVLEIVVSSLADNIHPMYMTC